MTTLAFDEDVDEATSLLARSRSRSRSRTAKITPLPKLQLATVFAIKVLIPICGTQVMPYINEMMEKSGLSKGAGAGYYSGLLTSSFGIAQLLSMYPWARLSDHIGRLPVILIGTLGVALSSTFFGLSKTFPMMLVTRFFSGIFCGTTGAIHSVVGELSDETNQSTAFPLYDICSAIGFAIGPLLGGTFANPAEQFPAWFNTPFFDAYPYILPCFITSLTAIGASLLAIFVLEETLPAKRRVQAHEREAGRERESLLPPIDIEQITPPTARVLLARPLIRAICLASGLLGFIAGSFNHVFTLMAYTPVREGGLALSVAQIGRAMFFMGASSVCLKLCMPLLLRRFDSLRVLRAGMLVWPLTFAAMPLLSLAAGTPGQWLGIGVVLVMSRVGTMVFSIVMILVREHAPGPASLGATNGLTEVAQGTFGSLGPTITSSLFALSASKHLLGGHLWAVFMVVVSALANGVAEWIKRHRDVSRSHVD
ncbi:MFS general substrate transporter [Gloeophyllum trabeum ATCC 11539]|uniref:MFS general substrate transporter n=1 Tax=Gloeophyllum trabeum (strain ATCC 11539 / FP-39264 / Madison 617) TaxID=670483 RepID=S7RH01_GLOTA|nr:MFS general substrate transporter [Gloeophyllum trabeum ATCC 11539]EPQ51854.1 MFS general substrate transporter [Gloeophyllum trabeum ATCC 11539]